MIRILLSFFCTYQSSCSRTVMAVSDIKARHLGKFRCNCGNILIIAYNPKLMTETINWSNEIIFRCCCCITHQKFVKHLIIRISEKYWFDIGIAYTHMLHTVFFLIAACQLMFLDDTRHIVVYIRTYNKTILSLAIHSLCIDIILFLIILFQPAILLELSEVLCSAFIHSWIVLRSSWFEIDFRFNNMIKALLVIACLGTCFLRIENIVRTRLNLLNEIFRRSYSLKRFYYCHNISFKLTSLIKT